MSFFADILFYILMQNVLFADILSAVSSPSALIYNSADKKIRPGIEPTTAAAAAIISSGIKVARLYIFIPKIPIWVFLEALLMENVSIF
jgi:hypothetical protein